MSEVQSTRASGSRGRGGFRGGRGGYRGGQRTTSRSKREDTEQENIPPASLDDQGEVGELKRKYGDKVPLLREVCPGWSDEDLVFALQETNGDIEAAVDRISTGTQPDPIPLYSTLTLAGNVSQWGEVKKKQPKSKESAPTSSETGATRGRGRGNFESRGRGRGTERGSRGARGARVASQANGTKHTAKSTEDGWGDNAATNTESSGAWDAAPTNGDTPAPNAWANDPGHDALSSLTTDEPKPASAAAPPGKKAGGWAGLFAKPPPKPASASVPSAQPEEAPAAPAPPPTIQEQSNTGSMVPPPIEPQIVEDGPSELPSAPHSETGPDVTPSKDELTETNLEQLPDVSHPPTSQTAVSTTASTQDPLTQIDSARPSIRPVSGYAATALKATGASGRSASFVRRVMEQQEAVVMPGNHAVEKTAVQFGKMGLNDDGDVDVDEDREEPETRTQLLDDSPAAPRASLPPTLPEAQAPAPSETQPVAEPQLSQRQAPGLPPAPQQSQHIAPPTAPGFPDSYRYGQPQKAYDPFGQQSTQAQTQPSSQEPFSSQVPGQSQPSSAQTDFSNYYNRDAYQQYYGGYGQGQDSQRTTSAFGTSSQETQGHYATARPQQSFGQQDAQDSGNNTPAPAMPAHQPQHSQHASGQDAHGAYPYGYGGYNQQYPQYGQNYMNQMSQAQMTHRYGANRPMFDDARRQQDEQYYGNQYAYGHNQQYGSYKSNMYGQPGQAGQQYSYNQHSASPANVGTFGGREAMYGRSGSAQPQEAQQSGASGHGYGVMPDPFGRTSSGFGQAPGMMQQHSGHQGSEDAAKPTGPSPAMQGGRPSSAVNTSQGQQGGFPPQTQHSGQQAFGQYPQYGSSFGNYGGQQNAHPTSGYGGYGSNAFGSYGGYGGGRGWNH